MKLIEYPDMDLLAVHLANILAGELTAALKHRERVLFVVPGGETPGAGGKGAPPAASHARREPRGGAGGAGGADCPGAAD